MSQSKDAKNNKSGTKLEKIATASTQEVQPSS